FEPVGRKHGVVKVEAQTKDGAPIPGFRLAIHADGPVDAPTALTLTAEDIEEDESLDDRICDAVATAHPVAAQVGKPGVPVPALAATLKKSEKTIRRGLKRLQAAGRVSVVGQASKGILLYAVESV